MPDSPDKTTAPASDKQPPPADRVGEELADDASIWPLFDKLAREDDERRTKTWDNGLNNLALFAGLFSAVTTAFIIEAQQDLEPDYAQMTFLVLNATAFGEKPVNQPFVLPSSARTVTCLWVASLILSLSAALIAIMGKDWIRMYNARPVCNLRQWAEMRVIAAAPVLLHLSLLLFGAGLVLFISSDPLTHHLTLGLSLAAGILYLVTTLSAVMFSASPFKSPATQMIRAAISVSYSHFCSIIYQPKRKPLRTLVSEILAMIVSRADGTTFLPGVPAENVHWYSGLWLAIVQAHGAAIAYMRKMPAWVFRVHNTLTLSSVQSGLHSFFFFFASSARRLSFDLFLSSTWTELPTDRRPKLLGEALSWLSGASQSPDVFRAMVFALGDLDIGPQVGKHTSLVLRTRLRGEIRRTWQQVDFLTLSRYVLADRNTPGEAALTYRQFFNRFRWSKDSVLRCEDGIAAFILSNRYRNHLLTTEPFSLSNLEAHLYQTLDTRTRDAYTTAVTVEYGGTVGAIELLTFLCCHGVIEDVTIPAAVELIMELLAPPYPDRRCLAYLFGSSKLCDATWKNQHWSSLSVYLLSRSLETFCCHAFEPSSVRTLSDDWQFYLALARTAAMLLSPQLYKFVRREPQWLTFLHRHLCQSQSPSIADTAERPDVIQLILDNVALRSIVDMAQTFRYDDNVTSCGTAILAAIIRHLFHRLLDPASIHDGEQLFAALAHTEVKGPDGKICIWDLGEWLRTEAPVALEECPAFTNAMHDVHDALSALYPLCEHNSELRPHWDRIGYPGRPGDIFSSPFFDLGGFFANAEDPLSR